MDIALLSTSMSMAKVNTDVGVAMLDKSLDMMDDMGEGMIKIMESSVYPELGQSIDTYA